MLFTSKVNFADFPTHHSIVGGLAINALPMKILANLWLDETGGEVLEYALIAGLIVVAAVAVISSVGGRVLARWNSLNRSL
jgi:pilus assembly protein Flp/PilA